jgi:hypothetical protein
MLTTFTNTLMSAEADAVCGAPYGMAAPDRVNARNGDRHRDFDTRAGTLDVAIPKLRSGSYFPDWLLERRRRSFPPGSQTVQDAGNGPDALAPHHRLQPDSRQISSASSHGSAVVGYLDVGRRC